MINKNDELPEPLVGADVDLRGLEWMPYYGDHVARSDFNASASDAVYRAGHNLWWAAWNSVPASSLPNDDVALARYADLGRDVKAFCRIKDASLSGFIRCSDGRWYHVYLSKLAKEAWARRLKERDRKAKWRSGQNTPGDANETGTEQVCPKDEDVPETGTRDGTGRGRRRGQGVGQDGDGTDDRTGQDRTGQELKESKKEDPLRGNPVLVLPTPPTPLIRPEPAATENPEKTLFEEGKSILGQNSGGLISKLKNHFGGDVERSIRAIRLASDKENPREYLGSVLRNDPIARADDIAAETDALYARLGVQ